MVGNAARLDCPYPYRSDAKAIRLRFHWSRVTSERDHNPVRIIPDNRLVVGLDGMFYDMPNYYLQLYHTLFLLLFFYFLIFLKLFQTAVVMR